MEAITASSPTNALVWFHGRVLEIPEKLVYEEEKDEIKTESAKDEETPVEKVDQGQEVTEDSRLQTEDSLPAAKDMGAGRTTQLRLLCH
jgi:hypothetical protein